MPKWTSKLHSHGVFLNLTFLTSYMSQSNAWLIMWYLEKIANYDEMIRLLFVNLKMCDVLITSEPDLIIL